MSIQYTIFIIAVVALGLFMGYSAFASARLLQTWRPDKNPLLTRAENILRLVLIALCLLLGLLSGLDRETLGWTWPNPLSQIVRGVLWGLAIALVFRMATQFVIRHTGRRYYSSLVLELLRPASAREYYLLALAMIPAVLLEELLYRSLLIGGLSPVLPAWALVAIIGVAFGLLHSPQGLWGIFGAGMAGVLFGWLFLLEGSLLLPIVAHYVANMAQLAWAVQVRE